MLLNINIFNLFPSPAFYFFLFQCFQVDILVNNAGLVAGKDFLEIPDELITKVFAVNVFSGMWVSIDHTVIASLVICDIDLLPITYKTVFKIEYK